MRNLALTAGLFAGLSAPALAQSPPLQPVDDWTYVLLSDGTIAWDVEDAFRHPDGRVSVMVMVFENAPRPLPAGAILTAKASGPGQLHDFENRFANYSCTDSSMIYEGGMLFAVADGAVNLVADTPPRPAVQAKSRYDDMIRSHVCRGVKPPESAEAGSTGEMINIAIAHRRRSQ
jgi:hypothetical protein